MLSVFFGFSLFVSANPELPPGNKRICITLPWPVDGICVPMENLPGDDCLFNTGLTGPACHTTAIVPITPPVIPPH
jgi:hypothetical protein